MINFSESDLNKEIEDNISKEDLSNLQRLTLNEKVKDAILIDNNNVLSKNLILQIRLEAIKINIDKIETNKFLATILIFFYFRLTIKSNEQVYNNIKSNYEKHNIDFDKLIDTFVKIYNIAYNKYILAN